MSSFPRSEKHGGFPSQEQSLRSVFVGNIAYSVTEERLNELFSTVGTIVKFRLVRDRDTGRPKGFGFCEYQDIATAEAAIRNLNNFDLDGRTLKVDSAVNSAADKHGPDEFLTQTCTIDGGPETFDDEEPLYGPPVAADHCMEAITNVVTTYPPEKMFEVMREMKELARTDPAMGKALLDANPQLGFALLQLLVIMRTMDPRDALSMIHQEEARIDYPFYKTSADENSESFAPSTAFNHPDSKETKPAVNRATHPQMIPPQNQHPAAPARQPQPAAVEEPNPNDAESAEMLIQLLQLSEEHIAMLPPMERQQVRELQAKLRNVQ